MDLNVLSQFEHDPRGAIPNLWKVTRSDMILLYSKSVGYLFLFLQYNVLLYGILALLSLFSVWPAPDLQTFFFISGFPPHRKGILFAQWSVSFVWFLGSLLVYYAVVKGGASCCLTESIQTFLEQEDPQEAFYASNHPHCLNKIHLGGFTSETRNVEGTLPKRVRVRLICGEKRRILSGICFLLVLAVYGGVQWGIQYSIWRTHPDSLLFVFVGSVVHTVYKGMWRRLCWVLTRLESHDFWDSFYQWYFVKVYLFDVLSFGMFYLTRTLSLRVNNCPLDWLAEQFLWVLVLDYLGIRITECIWAHLQNLCGLFFRTPNHSDDSFRYKFIVIEEYVKIVLRQYYVLAGCLVFPMIAWIALVLGVIDYFRTLHKLVRLCGSPRRSGSSFAMPLLLAGGMNVVCAIVSYPGLLWHFLLPLDTRGCASTLFAS